METKTTVDINAGAAQQIVAPSTATEIDAEARIAELKKMLDQSEEYHKHQGYHPDRPDDFEESMMEETGDRSALAGPYGHSGRMKAVEGVDADMMERIKFLAGVTK